MPQTMLPSYLLIQFLESPQARTKYLTILVHKTIQSNEM